MLPIFSCCSSHCRRLLSSPHLRRPHRCITGAGGNRYGTEEQHIAKTLKWIKDKEPHIMIHVDKATTVGNTFLPGAAFHALTSANIRILVLTHGDILSKRALQHQISLAEDMAARNCGRMFFPTAIFVVSLKDVTKQKQLRPLVDAMFGAYYLNGRTHKGLVVSGIPNVGKSSLILPLTRGRTLKVKKKKHYHLPKVGVTAGLTLGIKSHVLECNGQKEEITLFDTPGVRRRTDDCDPETIRELVATNSTTYRKKYKTWMTQGDCVELALKALNRHADISEEPPQYVELLGLQDRLTNVDDFIKAVCKHRGVEKISLVELLLSCNQGKFGGLVFTKQNSTNLDRVVLTDLNIHSPIVYHNEFAKVLIEYGKNPGSIVHDPRLEFYTPPGRKRGKENFLKSPVPVIY